MNLRARWNGGRITVGELWSYFTRYPYMPRLRDRRVLERAVASVMDDIGWESVGFALAAGYDTERGDFLDLRLPLEDEAPRITDTTLLVAPALARAQRRREEEEERRTAASAESREPLPADDTGAAPDATATRSDSYRDGRTVPPAPEPQQSAARFP